jgi:hypothetical protein
VTFAIGAASKVGASTAPFLLTADAAPGTRLAVGTVVGMAALLGDCWVNRAVARDEERRKAALPQTKSLLHNHHLLQLLDLALAKSLEDAREQGRFAPDRAGIDALIQVTPGFFASLEEAHESALLEVFSVPRLVAVEPPTPESFEPTPQEVLAPEHAAVLLEELVDRAGKGGLRQHEALAARLAESLPLAVAALLKRDFGGGTPLEGQGFAALWLQVERQQRQDLAQLSHDVNAVAGALKSLDRRLEQRLRGLRVRALLADERLRNWLDEWRKELDSNLNGVLLLQQESLEATQQLEKRVLALQGLPLCTLAVFERRTWESVAAPSFLGPLLEDPRASEAIKGGAPGRAEELQQFGAFLSRPDKRVQYWNAMPGAGKTHLCLEFARTAHQRGWLVLFVDEYERGVDPAKQLVAHLWPTGAERTETSAKVLLIWDTSARAADRDVAESLYRLPRRDLGVEVKVVAVSWPTQTLTLREPYKLDAWFESSDLPTLVGRAPFADLIRDLLPRELASESQRVVDAANGNALDALSAVIELRSGATLASLGSRLAIQRSRYHRLLTGILPELGQPHAKSLVDTLRIVALVDGLTEAHCRTVKPDDAPAWIANLEALRQRGALLRTDDGVYRLVPDRFRIHLLWASLLGDGAFSIGRHERAWIDAVGEWLSTENLGAAFAVTQEALRDAPQRWRAESQQMTAHLAERGVLDALTARRLANAWLQAGIAADSNETRERLLQWQEPLLTRFADPSIALSMAGLMFAMTAEDIDAQACRALADRIEGLLNSDPAFRTSEIALELARALMNATVVAGPGDCRAFADRIEGLLNSDRAFHTPAIALELAKALYNATVGAGPEDRRALADRIEGLFNSDSAFHTPEIALELAQALYNGTVVAGPENRRVLADRIECLLNSDRAFHTPEIALELARSLMNATVGAGPENSRALADRIDGLLNSDPAFHTPEIALQMAKALTNATFGAATDDRRALADRIEGLFNGDPAFHTPEIALRLAKTLMNATFDAGSEDRRALADRIEDLLNSDPAFHTPEIALEFARAVYNATVGAGPEDSHALADRIEGLLNSDPAFHTPEIALELARALMNATVVAGPDDSRALADRIEGLLNSDRAFRTPEIALELARALYNATVGAGSDDRRALADRIEGLLNSDRAFHTPEVAMQLARALYNATVVAVPEGRRALADRIEGLLNSDSAFHTPEIALQLAKALMNATVGAVPEDRHALVDRIGGLLNSEPAFHTPEIALELAKALLIAELGSDDRESWVRALGHVENALGRAREGSAALRRETAEWLKLYSGALSDSARTEDIARLAQQFE